MNKPIASEHGLHQIKYRPDVDGLRAVAVICVVLFHAFPSLLPGGFVGVDVFFVISGYLITSIIVSDLDDNKFSFLTFYARRVRRLFPALLAVMVFCAIVGWFVLFPAEYWMLGKHIASGAAFIGNFVFWKEANYFDTSANTKILLHLWSLGVEEQYYLVWPALILAARKVRPNLALLSLVLLLGSFAISVHTSVSNPPAAFYSPASRFWEFLVGGLLAYVTQLRPVMRYRLPLMVREAAAMAGVILLGIAVIEISPKTTFPGWWALAPTLGTCLLVLSGPLALINSHLLSKSKLKDKEPFDYVEQRSAFCNSDGCLTYLGDDRRTGLITFDNSHLHPFASVYLAQKQLVPLIISALRGDEANAAAHQIAAPI
ncbi:MULTISPECIES: acyltransferase [unclassified Bradyrhizobium]|uniref:acyltransferase family protein n=1 Tax=unclassified Bradyrhizobium TaxID=2631580 RepID=UPI0029166F69|nr:MULTISPECIES: acyltransferase [unclassified Bradyrhizobium]